MKFSDVSAFTEAQAAQFDAVRSKFAKTISLLKQYFNIILALISASPLTSKLLSDFFEFYLLTSKLLVLFISS